MYDFRTRPALECRCVSPPRKAINSFSRLAVSMISPRATYQSLYWFRILILGVCGLFSVESQAEEALIPPGMKLTAPVFPAGLGNATLALNQRLSIGVEPAHNAAVHLLQLFGGSVLDENLRDASCGMMGIESLDPDLPRFIFMRDYVRVKHPTDKDKQYELLVQLEKELSVAENHLWHMADHPLLTQFFVDNEEALNRAIEIANLPNYFAPILSADTPPSLMSASFAIEFRLPALAHSLSVRALGHFAGGNFEAAQTDLLAAHKYALLVANGSPLDISIAKAHLIDSYPFRSEMIMMKEGNLNVEQAKQLLDAIVTLPRLPPSSTAAEIGERLTLQQEIELLRDDETAMLGFFDWDAVLHQLELTRLQSAGIQWDVAIKRGNEIQDEIVATLSEPDRKKQLEEIERLNAEAASWSEANENNEATLYEMVVENPESASKWIGESLAMALRPNLWQRIHTDHRGAVRRDLTIIGFALIVAHRKSGSYPAQLSDLAPEILSKVPVDAHTDEMFGYQQLENEGVQLISWGADKVSNSGNFPSDDLWIDLP